MLVSGGCECGVGGWWLNCVMIGSVGVLCGWGGCGLGVGVVQWRVMLCVVVWWCVMLLVS